MFRFAFKVPNPNLAMVVRALEARNNDRFDDGELLAVGREHQRGHHGTVFLGTRWQVQSDQLLSGGRIDHDYRAGPWTCPHDQNQTLSRRPGGEATDTHRRRNLVESLAGRGIPDNHLATLDPRHALWVPAFSHSCDGSAVGGKLQDD